jgi:hypothetical protein
VSIKTTYHKNRQFLQVAGELKSEFKLLLAKAIDQNYATRLRVSLAVDGIAGKCFWLGQLYCCVSEMVEKSLFVGGHSKGPIPVFLPRQLTSSNKSTPKKVCSVNLAN